MSFSSWLSRRLFSILDSDRVFEEMDRMKLEEKMLESQESEDRTICSSKRILSSFVVAVGGITVAKSYQVETWKLASVGAGIGLLTGITMTIGYFWCQKRSRCIRKVIVQLERTKTALRKRRQVFFSVSMRIPRSRHPLILRSCRIAVSLIECLVEKTIPLNSGSTWQDLYTDEIHEVVRRSLENPEILRIEEIEGEEEDVDFEAIFETLIAVFKLHASEYSRVVLIDFLESFCFRNFRRFLETCGALQSFVHNLETIERLALKSEREKSSEKTEQQKGERKIDMTIEWRQQTVMALEAILESLESENVQRSQIELALHKTLVIVGSEKINNPKTESSGILQTTHQDNLEVIIIQKGKGERTDVDMVFEGVPLSDADKLAASKSTVTRDVLLDGSEGRRHEASLFGELQLVLEPRRSDFEKRERAALAKFYGVDEHQLEKMEKKEETFEGVGAGGDEDPEPYDWRKDAETSAGIHQEADNDDFLKALKLRRVEDDIIE
ncbi:hypothetical protein B9Z55_013615 [Caenorhabditis nigoni]|uniref:Uncharacterized protein n=2 Tax=Caenorhabditis nigoni TaxID=1611254 RepID=A0A2G5U312_9PELO|nr:hypothetical protein B9Z55_013615 [Caenorhabditis nigoni]